MYTLAKKIIPESLKKPLRPHLDKARLYNGFRDLGGHIESDSEIRGNIASFPIDNRDMKFVFRSERELRRWYEFLREPDHIVTQWMNNLKNCKNFWDVGASNGIVGLYVSHLHQCGITFLEPFTPSIETILKSVYIRSRNGNDDADRYEIVHALVDSRSGYQRLDMHESPVPGNTKNSAHDGKADYTYGGRANDPVKLSQWIASVCLDDLVEKHKLAPPDAVKIDIDGFEMRALEGAKSLLSSGEVQTWCIESNDNNQAQIINILTKHGYRHEGEYVHYPEMKEMSPRDLIFYKG